MSKPQCWQVVVSYNRMCSTEVSLLEVLIMGYCNDCKRITLDAKGPLHSSHDVTLIDYDKLLKLVADNLPTIKR